MKTKNYPCAQTSLYQVARSIYNSMNDNLVAFTTAKPKYDANYITASLAELNDAKNIQDYHGRTTQAEVDYDNVVKQLNQCISRWKMLKSYINATFKGEEQQARLDEAGAPHYSKANAKNWDAAVALLNSSSTFLDKHAAALMLHNNMPANFQADFQTDITQFETILDGYRNSEKKVKMDTEAKVAANNKVYDKIVEICYDGQQIFKDSPALKEQFIFNSVLEVVSGVGTTGIRGNIYNSVTKKAIANVVVSSPQWDKTYKTNEDGLYEIKRIATGTYQMQFTCEGYHTVTQANFEVETGVTRNLSIEMTPNS